jgi:hypothetical protein
MADIDKIKKSKTLALFGWAMVVFSPLALIGLVYPANEYQAIGRY